MKAYEGVEIDIHSCLMSVLDDGGMSTSLIVSFSPPPQKHRRKNPGTYWIGG